MRVFFFFFSLTLLSSCSDGPQNLYVVTNGKPILKSWFEGSHLYLKSAVEVQTPGEKTGQTLFSGNFLDSSKIVQFVIHEKSLDVVAIQGISSSENPILATFPLTGTASPEAIAPDFSKDGVDPLRAKSAVCDQLEFDRKDGSILFDIRKQLADGTSITERYSFLLYRPDTYVPKEYPFEVEDQIGFFRTGPFLTRRDPTRPVVYYFSNNFPGRLKRYVLDAIARWNASMQKAISKSELVLSDNTGQRPGDLRYNLIQYIPRDQGRPGVLGYAPFSVNPTTGEILKADVILYEGTIDKALAEEQEREALLSKPNDWAVNPSETKTPLSDSFEADFNLWLPGFHGVTADDKIEPVLTRWEGQFLAAGSKGMSRGELETRIVRPVALHELGHTLGLRHNFLSGVDAEHFTSEKFKSSSVMNYAYLFSEEPTAPGSYDEAALAYGYGNTPAASVTRNNFLYCTDQQVASSINGLCNQAASGATAEEAAKRYLNRYLADYLFLNLSPGHGGMNSASYEAHVRNLLLPLRTLWDYCYAIVEAGGKKDYKALWVLLRQRIAPNEKSDATTIVTVKVVRAIQGVVGLKNIDRKTITVDRQVDPAKVDPLIADAQRALDKIVQAFAYIAADTERPNDSVPDDLRGRIQVLGVLPDKIAALLFLGNRTNHPLVPGRTITPLFDRKPTAALFGDIISNTRLLTDKWTNKKARASFDGRLRQTALSILKKDPVAAQWIALKKVTGEEKTDLQNRTALDDLHAKRQALLKEELLDPEKAKGNAPKLAQLETSFAAIPVDFLDIPEGGFLKANLSDTGIPTASGQWIRANIGLKSDELAAASEALAELEKAPNKDQAKIDSLTNTVFTLQENLASERRLLSTIAP